MLIGHSLINRMSCAGLLLHCGAFAASIGLTDVRTFPVPFGDGVNQLAINDVGDIAGTSFSLTRPPAGFVIPANGSAPSQIVKAGAQFTYVNGINNQGTLVGFYRDSSGFPGFSYSAGVFAPITVAAFTLPTDINNRGDVTGYFTPVGSAATGFVITSGNLMTFSIPGFPFDTYATGLNDSGEVVGYFNHVSSGFLRHTDGSFETFAFPASGIDNKGIIVGNGSGPNNTAVGMARIGSVNYTLVLPGVADFDVLGINNADEVVGIYGFAPTERIFEGRLSVPEPSTTVPIALMVVAGLVFARVRGQRRLWTH